MPHSSSPAPADHDALSWLSGGGEMGALIRSMDWSKTKLGPLELWPQSLRTSVSLCLSSTFPILVAWGPDDVQIYNDAYRPICGDLHPQAMGAPFREIWASAMPVVGDAFDRAHKGEGAYIKDQRMFLDRLGYLEEAFMTFSFSPIRDESGEVGGVFHPITESTATVLSARRTQALRDLSTAIGDARTVDDIGRDIAAQFPHMTLDLPFLLLYQIDADSGQLTLQCSVGLDAHPQLAPTLLDADDALWPFARTAQAGSAQRIDGIAPRFAGAACGPYEHAPETAMVLPVSVPGQEALFGFVVAGVSAARALDADYLHFYESLGAAVNTAVGNVIAYEKEQRRAEELAQIDRAKTAFFSNVSHEFRTPLTLILGPLDDALADLDDPLGPAQRKRIDVTHRNALRLLKLVNSLLDFSRIEAGRVQATYVPTDLARLTADLASVFESAMAKGGLAYEVDLQDPGEPVWVDRDMWEKIVFNLLSNAFKFTLKGRVGVSLRRIDGMVRLTVQDTGSGIPEAELPRVFERFHRIEGTPGRTYEGTGIGLALIQELVRLHGGSIAVHSVLGDGTRFEVDIPFGHAHLPETRIVDAGNADGADAGRMGAAFVEEALRWLPDEAAPAVVRPAAAGTLLQPAAALPRILIADDNNDMRAYLKALLDPHAEVTVCADGEAAFVALQRGLPALPDLLLSDVMMPKLDGFGLIARIRADAALRHLPVILLSARAGEEAKVEGLQAGADDYLVKPFAANELLARVQRQVELGRERQLHLQALGMRESYFRSLIDVAPVIMWTTDEAGMCTYLSRRWAEYTGRSWDQDQGMGWMNAVHPEDYPRTRAAFLEANATRTSFKVDYRLRLQDGSYRWFVDDGMPRVDEAGRPNGYVGTVTDIHVRTLLQLRLERVARAGDIGVWYADAPFSAFRLNEQMAAHLGLDGRHEVAGADLLAAVAEEDRARVEEHVAHAMGHGMPVDVEFRQADAAAGRWLRAVGWCDLDDKNQPLGFDGVTLDISHHKNAQQELERLANELAERNRMQSEFLFTLAHELRNPLAPIRTGLELMRVNPAMGQSGDVQGMIKRQVDHMVHLVDDLLDMARLSEGKVELRRSAVLLDEVVQDAVEMSMPLVSGGGHHLELRLLGAPLPLYVDRHRIAQVLSNLLNNAAKYTPQGGRIVVDAAIEDGEVMIGVTDTGIGIEAGMLSAIFDMYAQVQEHATMAQGGLGVGLNLVKRLVELHGGRVRAWSAGLGEGSRFTVILPVEAVGTEAPAQASSRPAPAASRPPGDGLRILVVDDNADAAEMLQAVLEMSGHAVAVAYDGKAALARAASFRPDAVFLDIGLPDQSGFEVAQALRRIDGMDKATLVALTGWGAHEDRQRSSEAGFDAHLTKPADLDRVHEVLRDAAQKAGR